MTGKQLKLGGALWRRCLLAATILLTAALSPARADTLILQGSTTFSRLLLETHKGAIEAASGHELTVIPNKSTPGLIALMEGRAHMAMLSASLADEIEILKKVMPGLGFERLRAIPVFSTRVSMAVNPSNPIRKLPLQSVRRVLLGEISNWSALGGKDQRIRIVLVGGGGGVTTVIESELLSGQAVSKANAIYVKTPIQLVQVVEQEPGALGFAQLALVKQRELPELTTDKPVEQVLSLVTVGDPTPAMQSVIDAIKNIAEKQM